MAILWDVNWLLTCTRISSNILRRSSSSRLCGFDGEWQRRFIDYKILAINLYFERPSGIWVLAKCECQQADL